ncbi:MAG TPA: hypothetical protein VM511_02805, partial [Luteolibacter sp.]|nr:hypothetical protein [Luteolibacter sp.]
PASFRYPPDWNYTQEETEKEKAEKRSLEKYIERTKRDLRIGEPDSEWNMTFDEDGVPSVFRKTSEGENRS